MPRIVFTGADVFDGTGAEPARADVAVEDGRIVAIGSALDGDEAVPCEGKTITPGFFDCHTHVMFSHIDFWRALQEPFSLRYFDAVRNLRATLDAGITSVRDAGGADLGVKTAVERGLVPGPRMQISIAMLSQTGGHADGWMPCGTTLFDEPVPGVPRGIVDGPDEMRRRVRELVRAGADVIKVATSGGVLSPRDKPTHAHFRDAELRILVEEAAAAGLWVMAHAQASEGIKAAVRNGIRSIEHGIYLDDEAIDMMLEHGTYLVPTLVAPQGVLDAVDAGAQIPEESIRKAREVMETHRASFKRAVAAGVKVAMGTDSGVTPHGRNLRELALMAEFGGMSATEVLAATTSGAARLLGVEEELGTIEEAKRADLVVIDGGLGDLTTLPDRIEAVYLEGARIR